MSDSAANQSEEGFEFDCPECGTHISGEVDRCPRCGVEFIIEEVPEAECPQCHAIIPVESVKCPRCGLGFEAPSAAPAAEAPAPAAGAPEPPAEAAAGPAPGPVITQDQLRERFSSMVSQVKPLLALAKEHGIDVHSVRKLIDRAVEAGKNKDVEGAVRTLKECLAELDRSIDGYLDRELASLEDLAGVTGRTGGDPAPIAAAARSVREKRAEKDAEGALAEVRGGKKIAERLAGPYVAAQEQYGALEKLVQASEGFFVDVREARRLLDLSKEAGDGGDWATMAALARQGRDDLARALPGPLKSRLHEAKQEITKAKLQGKNVSDEVKALKEAGAALKLKRYEEALFLLARAKDGPLMPLSAPAPSPGPTSPGR